MTALSKSSANNKAFGNKTVNNVLLSLNLPRENMALGKIRVSRIFIRLYYSFSVGDTVIDESLTVPREYCDEEDHQSCVHACVLYDRNFPKEDRIRKLNFTDSFSIPSPDICRALWRFLSEKISTRKSDEEASFYVQWGISAYNVVELTTLRMLGEELQRTKTDVMKEKEFLMNGRNHLTPNGIENLNEDDADIAMAINKILKDKLYLNQDIPLCTVDRTMGNYGQLDNEMLFNFSHPSRQLTEEDIHIIMEILNKESKGSDLFLVFTPEMSSEVFCQEYAVRKGCKTAENIHIILNISPGRQLVNTTNKNGHWVYVVIKNHQLVLYGDPLGSRFQPSNLFKVLNPIYEAKFGKRMLYKDVKIINCSNNTNFPIQKDSIICGILSAMLCVISFSPKLYNEVMHGITANPQLEFIQNPSYYADQIRMVFLKILMSKTHCVQRFMPSLMTFHYNNGDESIGNRQSSRKSKSTANKAWEPLMSRSRSKNPVKKSKGSASVPVADASFIPPADHSSTSRPAAPTTSRPNVPKTSKPAAPTTSRPAASTTARPASPKTTKPAAPTTSTSAAPTTSRPGASTTPRPAAPTTPSSAATTTQRPAATKTSRSTGTSTATEQPTRTATSGQTSTSRPLSTNTSTQSATTPSSPPVTATSGTENTVPFNSSAASPSAVPSSPERTTLELTDQLVDLCFIGLKDFKSGCGYPNIDGSSWSILPGRKGKGAKKFICSQVNCKAQKSIFKRKGDTRKKIIKKNPNDPITVNYTTMHTCIKAPSIGSLSTSSYYVKNMRSKKKLNEDGTSSEINEDLDTPEQNGDSGSTERETIEETGFDECEHLKPIDSEMEEGEADTAGSHNDQPIEVEKSPVKQPKDSELEEGEAATAGSHNDQSFEVEKSPVKKTIDSEMEEEEADNAGSHKERSIEVEKSPVGSSEEEFANDTFAMEVEIETDEERHDQSGDSNDNFGLLCNGPSADDYSASGANDDIDANVCMVSLSQDDPRAHEAAYDVDLSSEELCCYLCEYKTTSQSEYDEHQYASHGKRCPMCPFATTSEIMLNKHQREEGHLQSLQCCQCNFEANRESVLIRHIETVHEEIQQADTTVNELLMRTTSKRRRSKEEYQLDKRIRIDTSVKETSPEMFEQSAAFEGNSGDEAMNTAYDEYQSGSNHEQDMDESEKSEEEEETITTSVVKEYRNDMDKNHGNIAYIINDFPGNKKPASDRKLINWGVSQTQRGRTTCYPCAGNFICKECRKTFDKNGNCSECKIPLEKALCPAKKYIFFCNNVCRRAIFKGCCQEDPNHKKLVVLYVGVHTCVTVDSLVKQSTPNYSEVRTMEDVIENISICMKTNSERFSVDYVEKVPCDIDGDRYILIDNDDSKELQNVIRDGRKWKTYVQTSSQTLSNILGEEKSKNIRKYKCSPQYFCFYEECPFKRRFELVNQVNWTTEDGKKSCASCSEAMERIDCTAEKFVGKSENGKFVIIKHQGKHKCLAKTTLESEILEEMESFFEKNPTATRSEAIVHHLVNKISFGSQQDVIDLVSISLNIWEINNAKMRGIKRLNPHGNKMEAIRHFQKKIIDIGNPFGIIMHIFDDVWMCDVCHFTSEGMTDDCVKFCASCSMSPMQNVGPSVFISSTESLKTLRELTAGKSLATEACCLDHQPSRLRQFTTFAAYTYDLDLRRMCPLFSAVMTNEKELSVFHTLEVVDRCMLELFDTENIFNPNIMIADEATAIKNAVARKLGEDKVQQSYGTCQLHFQMSILQHCSYIIGETREIWQFMKLSESLMTAADPMQYNLLKKELVGFISKNDQRHDYLMNWFEFYDSRKTGWSNAFRNPELPKTNKGMLLYLLFSLVQA